MDLLLGSPVFANASHSEDNLSAMGRVCGVFPAKGGMGIAERQTDVHAVNAAEFPTVWPAYNPTERPTRIFDLNTRVEIDPAHDIRLLWDETRG